GRPVLRRHERLQHLGLLPAAVREPGGYREEGRPGRGLGPADDHDLIKREGHEAGGGLRLLRRHARAPAAILPGESRLEAFEGELRVAAGGEGEEGDAVDPVYPEEAGAEGAIHRVPVEGGALSYGAVPAPAILLR